MKGLCEVRTGRISVIITSRRINDRRETINIIKDLMTTKEAAEYLGYTVDYISKLCKRGKLPGAQRAGERMWLIPRQSVLDYEPGPRGFTILQNRKRAEKKAFLSECNEAIRAAKSAAQVSETAPAAG